MHYLKKQNILIVYGGRTNDYSQQILSDIGVLTLDDLTWKLTSTFGEIQPPRFGHCSEIIGEKLYVFGGVDGKTLFPSNLSILELEQSVARKLLVKEKKAVDDSMPKVSFLDEANQRSALIKKKHDGPKRRDSFIVQPMLDTFVEPIVVMKKKHSMKILGRMPTLERRYTKQTLFISKNLQRRCKTMQNLKGKRGEKGCLSYLKLDYGSYDSFLPETLPLVQVKE